MKTAFSSIILSFAMIASVASPASAQEVAPLVPLFEPAMAGELILRFHEAMSSGLRTGGLKVMSPQTVREQLKLGVENAGCFEGVCLDNARSLLNIERLAVAKVTVDGKNYGIEVRMFKGRALLGSGTGRCEICTLSEAVETMTRVSEELGTRTEEPEEPDAPKPAVPTPRPATVKPRPALPPATTPTSPGPATKPTPAAAPKPAPKAVVTKPPAAKPAPASARPVASKTEKPEPVEPSPRRPFPLWPGATLGAAGLAAVGAGIALLVIDGKGVKCHGPSQPDDRNCVEIYNTDTGGWVLTGLGAAAIAGAGALLYFHLSSRPKEESRAGISNLSFGPTSDGGLVFSAGGRF